MEKDFRQWVNKVTSSDGFWPFVGVPLILIGTLLIVVLFGKGATWFDNAIWLLLAESTRSVVCLSVGVVVMLGAQVLMYRSVKLARQRESQGEQPTTTGTATNALASPNGNAGDGQGEKESAKGIATVQHLAWLRQNIAEYFNLDELRTLCFDMDIKHENLAASTLDGMARELVAHCERTGKIRELVAKLRKLRSNVSWEDVPE